MSNPPDPPRSARSPRSAPAPSDPASNTPSAPTPANNANPSTAPAPAVGGSTPARMPGGTTPIFLDQNANTFVAQQQQQQRASLSSLMFMTFFFFMMSGGSPPMTSDEYQEKRHSVDSFSQAVENLQLYLNGSETNFTLPSPPIPSALTLLPPHLHRDHSSSPDSPASANYYQNITGFYQKATAHYLNLTDPSSSNSTSTSSTSNGYFKHLNPHPHSHHPTILSLVNATAWNETRAEQLRGGWGWADVNKWEMSISEKAIVPRDEEGEVIRKKKGRGKKGQVEVDEWDDWAWVHISQMNFANKDGSEAIDYNLAGVHQRSTGEYTMVGMPSGQGVDVRKLLVMMPDDALRNATGKMVLFEMQKHLNRIRADPSAAEQPHDDDSEETSLTSTCPLELHLRLLPVPFPYSRSQLKEYEDEMRNPTGIWVQRPPGGMRIEGVAVFEECGFAFGLSGGVGIEADHFWNKSIHYASFSAIANLIILGLFVYQMENTRTPSGLAKVSFWSVALMVGADSWLFSAHAVVAIMSDNGTTLPLLIPSFICLCTALVFGPRFGVLLYRVQAPETANPPARPMMQPAPIAATTGATATTPPATPAPPRIPSAVQDATRNSNPRIIFPLVVMLMMILIGVVPQIVPVFLVVMYSFWIPQIWRNARRGVRKAVSWRFVLGMSGARLALPLYAFACPDNVFFTENTKWVWALVAYVWVQVGVLVIQERFTPSFFLPKSLAPPPPYDYHQPIPHLDTEAGQQEFGDCSICMEPIVVSQVAVPSTSTHKSAAEEKASLAAAANNVSAVGSRVMNMNLRRTYALAPCHHLFHTECLSQWMAIKNTCPLCKRGLPPL